MTEEQEVMFEAFIKALKESDTTLTVWRGYGFGVFNPIKLEESIQAKIESIKGGFMSTRYEINQFDEVVPIYGGRVSNNTREYREATELELTAKRRDCNS